MLTVTSAPGSCSCTDSEHFFQASFYKAYNCPLIEAKCVAKAGWCNFNHRAERCLAMGKAGHPSRRTRAYSFTAPGANTRT